MTNEEQLVATQFWFAWDDPTARRALLAAVMSRFLPTVERVLTANRASGRCPTSWVDFQALRRNPRNIARIVTGEYGTTLEFLVGAAAVLQLDVREFFPDTVEWVALATFYVVSTRRREELQARGYKPQAAFDEVREAPNGLTLDDARTYAKMLLQHPPCRDHLPIPSEIEDRWQSVASDRRVGVRRVIEQLATILVESDRVLARREKSR